MAGKSGENLTLPEEKVENIGKQLRPSAFWVMPAAETRSRERVSRLSDLFALNGYSPIVPHRTAARTCGQEFISTNMTILFNVENVRTGKEAP